VGVSKLKNSQVYTRVELYTLEYVVGNRTVQMYRSYVYIVSPSTYSVTWNDVKKLWLNQVKSRSKYYNVVLYVIVVPICQWQWCTVLFLVIFFVTWAITVTVLYFHLVLTLSVFEGNLSGFCLHMFQHNPFHNLYENKNYCLFFLQRKIIFSVRWSTYK
jgi:hypothetical protein